MAWRAAAVDFDSSSTAAKQAVGKVIGTLEVASQNVVKDVVGGEAVEVGNPHLFHSCTAAADVAIVVVVGRSSC
jgi:hypothetical protein